MRAYQIKKHSMKLALILLASVSTKVWADDTVVGYEDLVQELSQKTQPVKASAAYDSAPIRFGVGYVNSFSNFSINKQNYSRSLAGVQVRGGFEFQDPRFFTELSFTNFGVSSYGNEDISMREIGAGLGFQESTDDRWSYSVKAGLIQRSFKFSDGNEAISEDSSSLAVSTGAAARIYRKLFIGFDVAVKSALASQVTYRNAVDFGVHIQTTID